MGFKEFRSLSFCDYGSGHVKQFYSAPFFFFPTCYTHISFILARNWACKNSLESSFDVGMCSCAEVNHLEPQSIQKKIRMSNAIQCDGFLAP